MTEVIDQAVAELLDRSNERDLYTTRIGRAYREGWAAGRAAGYAAGRQAEAAERDREWNRIARPIARSSTSAAELEAKRWTVRGERRTRETFGQPHPGDYPGQDGHVQARRSA